MSPEDWHSAKSLPAIARHCGGAPRRRTAAHRLGSLRIDDGARAEDLLLPFSVVDGDVPRDLRLRRREHPLPRDAASRVRSDRGGRCGARDPVRAHRPADGSPLGPQGLGRLVAVGCPAHLGAHPLDDLRGLRPAAAIRRARLRKAGGGSRALRHGERAVRVSLGQPVAHGAPEDHRGTDARREHAPGAVLVAVRRSWRWGRCCCSRGCVSSVTVRRSTRPICWRRRKEHDDEDCASFRVAPAACVEWRLRCWPSA